MTRKATIAKLVTNEPVNKSEIRLKATLRLHDDVASYRKSGWRTVCEFEHTVFPDGSRLVGFEATFLDHDRLKPGEEGLVEMRFWVPRDDFREVRAGTPFECKEGTKLVASGRVLEILGD
jgi:hypothetical protein